MAKIIKILTGPQEGAELELVPGAPVRIGSGDACDVVLVDAMAPEQAMEIIAEEDNFFAKALAPQIFAGNDPMKTEVQMTFPDYTVFTCGATRLAIGNTDKPWPPLSWLPLEKLLEKREKTVQEEEAEKRQLEEQQRLEREAQEKEEQRIKKLKLLEEMKAKRQARRHRIFGVCCWLGLFILCLLGATLAAKKAWELSEPPKEGEDNQLNATIQKLNLSNLESIISKFGLVLQEREGQTGKLLTGNLPTAAMRIHVERLLKNKYFGITYELTDDETLSEAVRELLWGATNGCVKLKALKDRNATVSGMTATQKEWDVICANIKADIPRLNKLDAHVVFADVMTAKLVKAFKGAGFKGIRTETLPLEIRVLGQVPEKRQKAFEQLLQEAVKYFPQEAKLSNRVKWIPEAEPLKPATIKKKIQSMRPLPIASILLEPVPCIVMADGSRYGTGAVIGDVTITKITPHEVTLKRDKKSFTFKP